MSYPFAIRGAPGDEYIQGTTQLHQLGTLMFTHDERRFRYALAGELLVCGESLQGPDEEVEVDLTVAAGSLADQFISVTGKGTEAANFYKDGYICITLPGSTQVRLYQVASHALLAVSAGHKITITDSRGTQNALIGDEEATLQANPWSNIKTNTGSADAGFAGIAVEDIASASYGWVQTGGPCVASAATAMAESGALTAVSASAGKVDVVGADTEPIIGYCIRGQTGTGTLEASLVMLTVD